MNPARLPIPPSEGAVSVPGALDPPDVQVPSPPPAGFGLRAQAWLRDRQGLAFDRIHPSPSHALVEGGSCLAWRYTRARWGWWGYVGACSMGLATLTAGVTMRRLDASLHIALTALAWSALAIAALAWTIAWETRRRDRYAIAVAWDAGERPLTAAERESIAAGLRARWPKARELWLITLRTMGLPENEAGLRVIPVREPDLPRLSAGARRTEDLRAHASAMDSAVRGGD